MIKNWWNKPITRGDVCKWKIAPLLFAGAFLGGMCVCAKITNDLEKQKPIIEEDTESLETQE